MKVPCTLHKPERVVFQGVTYRLMGGRRLYYLSQSTKNGERSGARGLHVAIWEAGTGKKVPSKHCVHHLDGNSFNNQLQNLECISVAEHMRHHHKGKLHPRTNGISALDHLAKIRPLAAAWHRSPEGRAWHKQHATGLKKKMLALVCSICGDGFTATRKNSKYCSSRCCMRATYARPHPKTFVCEICGSDFVSESYRPPGRPSPSSCSRACRGRLMSKRMQDAKAAKMLFNT